MSFIAVGLPRGGTWRVKSGAPGEDVEGYLIKNEYRLPQGGTTPSVTKMKRDVAEFKCKMITRDARVVCNSISVVYTKAIRCLSFCLEMETEVHGVTLRWPVDREVM